MCEKTNKISLKLLIVTLVLVSFSVVTFTSCNSDTKPEDDIIEDVNKPEIDLNASTILRFDNKLFSMPSPYQIAFLVKDLDIEFNNEFLNPVNKVGDYTSSYKKSINLGVYGADLGYLNIYEQTPQAVQYFSVIKLLSSELGIGGAFDASVVSRIENNMGNKDSLLYIISNSYRKADAFLKENQRDETSALILAGGWIESLNLLTSIALQDTTQIEIINRIAEQKQPLNNLIEILKPFEKESDYYTNLNSQLIELAYAFDGIDIEYTYAEPEVDVENKLSIINCNTNVIINEGQLKLISSQISDIRASIVE